MKRKRSKYKENEYNSNRTAHPFVTPSTSSSLSSSFSLFVEFSFCRIILSWIVSGVSVIRFVMGEEIYKEREREREKEWARDEKKE